MGIIFGFFGTIQSIAFFFIFQLLLSTPDLTEVRKRGIETNGEITRIKEVNNTTVNGEHPIRIDFSYDEQGEKKSGSMQTMDRHVIDWKPGTQTKVKYFNGQALLTEVSPFEFPAFVKYLPLLGIPFTAAGIGCLIISLLAAKRKFGLLKYGEIRPAEFRAVEGGMTGRETPVKFGFFQLQMMSQNQIHPRVVVNYAYRDSFDRELIGSSSTTDLTIARDLKRGDPLQILVHPSNEKISMILDTPAERALSRT